VFTTNVDGSEKRQPLVIGKAKKPHAFQNKTGTQLGFYYRNNAKAWMTAVLYQEWLQQWDRELVVRNRRILLLQDNFSGHIIPDGFQNIHVENFQANLTAHIQPLDQGIIRCFKAHYRAKFVLRSIDHYDCNITPSEIYNINQLEAMHLANAVWREVDTITIRHCWQKAGILPTIDPIPIQPTIQVSSLLNHKTTRLDQGDPVRIAETQVECTVDKLVSSGVLQSANRMDIESLLNLEEESVGALNETTDEEIFQAVLDAQEAAQDDGGDGDDDETVEACPTCCEVLQAAAVINRYIDSVDDPVARKLEAILGSFGQLMRLEVLCSMVPTQLTDYFR
jgi:hypothetical protein